MHKTETIRKHTNKHKLLLYFSTWPYRVAKIVISYKNVGWRQANLFCNEVGLTGLWYCGRS